MNDQNPAAATATGGDAATAAGGDAATATGTTQPPTRADSKTAATADTPNTGGPTRPEDGADLAEAFRRLEDRLDAYIKRNDLQQRAFDTLHDDLQKYKNAFLLNEFQRPVIRNLIDLYDRLLRIEETLPRIGSRTTGPSVEEFTADLGRFVGNLTGFRHALTEVLARLEVETYEERHDALRQEALQTLDAKLHRTIAVEPTDDPDMNNRVVLTHKPGFYWRERVFRPQEVTVLRYKAPAQPEENHDG